MKGPPRYGIRRGLPLFLWISFAIAAPGCASRMPRQEFNRSFPVRDPIVQARDSTDTDEARRSAAQRYLAAIDVERLRESMIHESAKALPEAERTTFFRLVDDVLTTRRLTDEMLTLSVKHYTPQQLDAMTRFYGTSETRIILYKSNRTTGPPVPSEGSNDTLEDRRVAAQRYMSVIDFRELYGDIVRGMATSFSTESEREQFFKQMHDEYAGSFRTELDRMTKYYTRREIDLLTRFYTTPEGQSVLRRLGGASVDLAFLIHDLVRQALQRRR